MRATNALVDYSSKDPNFVKGYLSQFALTNAQLTDKNEFSPEKETVELEDVKVKVEDKIKPDSILDKRKRWAEKI